MNPTALKRAGALALVLYAGSAFGDARLEARRHFRTGMSLIAQGQYDQGISELLVAYSIKPHPNVLYNIAQAYQDAGRWTEAADYLRRYIAANPPDVATAQATLVKLEESMRAAEAAKQAETAKPGEPVVPGKKPALPPMPAAPGGAEAARSLAVLVERLEKAIARAESLPATPSSASPARPTPADAEASGTGSAASSDEDEGAVPYEERVVTASRRAQSSLEAPNATSVITSEDIRLSGATTLPELLRRVPGADVMMLGPGSANFSVRGFNQRVANKVLVLVDGRTEYQDFLGMTLWSSIPVEMEDIERIEVIRGPGSALYGANAMLGVVNIITRAPGTGPKARFQAHAGNGNAAGGSFVSHGGSDGLRYRASAAYSQADKWSRDFAEDRPDVAVTDPQPNLGLRSARGNLATSYKFDSGAELGLSGGINRFYTEIYPLGLLRNFYLDGVSAFAKLDVGLGPLKAKAFWNHLGVDAGPQYEPVGQRSLATRVESNLFNGEVLYSKGFQLLGEHQVNVGVEGRLKRVAWSYLGPLREEFHAAAYVQDEWRLAQPLSVVASYRVDRHPLLNKGQPGLAHSPRISALFMPFEGHAFRASAASAFREPTFLESYMGVRVPIPGVNGASALSLGNRALEAEQMVALELGYRGEAPDLGMDWDVALYQHTVSNLIHLSAVRPLPAGESWDADTGTYLLGRSLFENEAAVYTARGAEAGVTLAPVDGLGIKASAAFQQVAADGEQGLCGPCSQAPQFKLFGGITYRTRQALELGVDVAWTSSTVWVEREPSSKDPTVIEPLANTLPAYAVINARVGYTPVKDRVSVALVGSNLGPAHAQHPFGNRIERRVLALLTVTP
ncbi:iron complex outermembrane receptor protein [Archangium gephyra]|uniref:Iron complex outermembrane receptor protein n=1 Tax=Archangium gephyra TaxID=48 RepID=A0AAC8QGM2_9BACT|nr:TonB-dependent receptor [Archangium gephyra]AKJ07114.1 TonB-dependent receptor [Archangium gephyra]REG26527.1 iron complex outermembrane receptor protein [Archangium gephyra]